MTIVCLTIVGFFFVVMFFFKLFSVKNSTKRILLHNEKSIKTMPTFKSVNQKPQKLQSVENKTFTVY